MKRKRRLHIAKPEFPPMRCDDGCGECCGPAPATQAEFDRVVEYVVKNKITPKDQGLTCPLYLDGRCSVYEVRPLACRAFGHVDGMDCAHGYNTNMPSEVVDGRIRANGEVATILHEVLRLVNPSITFQGVLGHLVGGNR